MTDQPKLTERERDIAERAWAHCAALHRHDYSDIPRAAAEAVLEVEELLVLSVDAPKPTEPSSLAGKFVTLHELRPDGTYKAVTESGWHGNVLVLAAEDADDFAVLAQAEAERSKHKAARRLYWLQRAALCRRDKSDVVELGKQR